MTNQTILTGPSFKAAISRKTEESQKEIVNLYYQEILDAQAKAVENGTNYFTTKINAEHFIPLQLWLSGLGFIAYKIAQTDGSVSISITPSC